MTFVPGAIELLGCEPVRDVDRDLAIEQRAQLLDDRPHRVERHREDDELGAGDGIAVRGSRRRVDLAGNDLCLTCLR
jgi:hypothetical protein